ncbi:MAG: hypothetical protein ABGX12_05595, partial [Desulfurobacteriaceae bacterium]
SILRRFRFIKNPRDFVSAVEGREKPDSIRIKLLAIREALKRIYRLTEGKIFEGYREIDCEKQ